VESAFHRTAAILPGGIVKFGFPRSDLSVRVGDVTLKPTLALGGWVAFMPVDAGQAMMMGDLVLAEEEVGPVMGALLSGGVEVTALHNHLLNESPHVLYMHVLAHGEPIQVAKAVMAGLARSKLPLAPAPTPAATSALELDTVGITRVLGVGGKLNGGVYQVSVPRSDKVMEMGREIPPTMGVATAINFQPTGAGKAAITGDFVLRASEVNEVMRALLAHGIAVTAVHSHMLTEQPRLFFMHFWANDNGVKLATGLRAALDRTEH
jgi:hypothetical protein